MTVEDLQLFLEGEQGVIGLSLEDCENLIVKYEPSEEARNNKQLLIDGFTQFLLSEECDIMSVHHKDICHDMTQPLTHYFISSSHNTWAPNQLNKCLIYLNSQLFTRRPTERAVECWRICQSFASGYSIQLSFLSIFKSIAILWKAVGVSKSTVMTAMTVLLCITEIHWPLKFLSRMCSMSFNKTHSSSLSK